MLSANPRWPPRGRGHEWFQPPVSLVLAAHADAYVRGLTSYRYGDESDWYSLFTDALRIAAVGSAGFAERVRELQGRVAEAGREPAAWLRRGCADRPASVAPGREPAYGYGADGCVRSVRSAGVRSARGRRCAPADERR